MARPYASIALAGLMVVLASGCETSGTAFPRQDTRDGATYGVSSATRREAESLYQSGLRLRREGHSRESVQRFLEAAELGHAGAAYELSLAYSMGQGVAKDPDTGARWLAESARLGDARARFMLGAALFARKENADDVSNGLAYLRQAAHQGHPGAQYLLGKAYVDGEGVAQDPRWAARWYGKAARAGHGKAQFAYGIMHGSGLGLPRNRRRAYMWLSLAAKQQQPHADDVMSRLRAQMKPEQVRQARQDADRFVASRAVEFADEPTVIYVQQQLNDLDHDAGPVDGIVGPRTRSGIRTFQIEQGLTADGKVSPALIGRLRTADR